MIMLDLQHTLTQLIMMGAATTSGMIIARNVNTTESARGGKKMGTIIYKPHCSKCGAIINQKVTYRGVTEEVAKNCLYYGYYIDIEPNRCACCGEVFGTIEIPMPKENNGNDD